MEPTIRFIEKDKMETIIPLWRALNPKIPEGVLKERLQEIKLELHKSLLDNLNLAALADPLATTVVYMGRRTFAKLADLLINAGLPPETPALLAEGVSTPEQALTRSTIAGLVAAFVETEPSKAPALILYGPLADG